jgi:hypothetical protein
VNSGGEDAAGHMLPRDNMASVRCFRELLPARVEHMLLNRTAQIEETALPLPRQ